MLTIFEELVCVAICSRSNLRSTGLVALGTDSNRRASHKNTIFFPCDFVGIIFMAVNLYQTFRK